MISLGSASCYVRFVSVTATLFVMLACVCSLSAQLDGTNGMDGDPGANGGDGLGGGFVLRTHRGPWVFGIADRGGHGGNGGNGVDGDDLDTEAAGGNGGHGGVGGIAFCTPDQFPVPPDPIGNAFARAGDGGNGGFAGVGSTNLLHGIGGNGGHGGHAQADTFNVLISSRLLLVGGNGGNAFGTGAIAGNGGTTSSEAAILGIPDGPAPEIMIEQYGGHGGNGLRGANAGSGAETILDQDSLDIWFPDLSRSNVRLGSLHGEGGSGGQADGGGAAGSAGNAVLDMSHLASRIGNEQLQFLDYNIELKGGNGGAASLDRAAHSSGKDGGHANTTGLSTFILPLIGGQLDLKLGGGRGGSAIGRLNTGDGGDGGSAWMAPLLVDGFSEIASVGFRVGAELQGGQGGHAQGGGIAGNGGSVELNDTITINTNSQASVSATTTGGKGGSGPINGHGGSANVVLDQAIQDRPPGPDAFRFRPHFAFGSATGGNSGDGIGGTNRANGGDANSIVRQTSLLGIVATAKSSAGIGFAGRSGDSNALAQAVSTGQPQSAIEVAERVFRAEANAIATFNSVESLADRRPEFGTNSRATALAIASAGAEADANAEAYGGWGTLSAGSANALATAVNTGIGIARSNAYSSIYNDRRPFTSNVAYSRAGSQSNAFNAEATSHANAIGHFNRAVAWSSIDAPSGVARAMTTTSTASWAHQSTVITEARLFNSAIASKIGVTSDSVFRGGAFFNSGGQEAKTDLILIPTDDFVRPLLSGRPIADVFNADADVLGVGRFRGGAQNSALFGQLQIESAVDVSLELQDFHVDKSMMLGLFGLETTGDGFSNLEFFASYNGNTIVDAKFNSLNEVGSFFDDNVFFIEALNGVTSTANFEFDFSMSITDSDDSLSFLYAFGNADPIAISGKPRNLGGSFSSVPEPTGGLLIGLTLIGMLMPRKRTNRVARPA